MPRSLDAKPSTEAPRLVLGITNKNDTRKLPDERLLLKRKGYGYRPVHREGLCVG